jgi:hypothetical protein
LEVYKGKVESLSVVRDDQAVPGEIQKSFRDLGKQGLVGQERVGYFVNVVRVRRNLPLGIYIFVERPSGDFPVRYLDRADLYDLVAVRVIKAGRLGVKANNSCHFRTVVL